MTATIRANDTARLEETIARFASLAEPGAGITRLAYTALEREAHQLFAELVTETGCTVAVDAAGNSIATRAGRRDGPAIGTGSHLDSVYHGGKFDGIAGVAAAVEVARQLARDDVETEHPLRFVVFAGEEGARFGQACVGSRLAAGLSTLEDLEERRDCDGVSIADAMVALGFDPEAAVRTPWRSADWAAFAELHVEQGQVLERTGSAVGVVDLVSGSTRLELVLTGRPSHTGGTPMRGRSDALAAAAEAVLIVEDVALDAQHRGTRATVGGLGVEPGSITTIPGRVTLMLDVRDVDADRQRQAAGMIVERVRDAAARRNVGLDMRLLADASPVVLSGWVRGVLADAAAACGASCRVMASGASHDSQMINRVVPAGMIFVPSAGGLSHVPEEQTSGAELATGAAVLREALLRLDRQLSTNTLESVGGERR